MFCGHCGYNNPNTSKFCLKCGSELAKYMPGGASAAAAATLRTPAQQQRPAQAAGAPAAPVAQPGMGAQRPGAAAMPQAARPGMAPMGQPAMPQAGRPVAGACPQQPAQRPARASHNRPSNIPDAGPAVRPGSRPVAAPSAAPAGANGNVMIPRGPVAGTNQPAGAYSQPNAVYNRPSTGVTVLDELMASSDHPSSSELPRIASDVPRSAYGPRMTLVRERGTRYEITEFPATVGKGSAANVRIEGNTAISRVHLLVRYTGQCFAVEDKNSTNGTCINGNRLEPGELVKLKNGDKVKMGNEVFTVEIR